VKFCDEGVERDRDEIRNEACGLVCKDGQSL